VTAISRRYPSAPVVGVGAVILPSEGSVVLIRRRQAPLSGRWTLPGGVVELGEALRDAVAREVQEETGLIVDVGPLVEVVEHIERDAASTTTYHFVIVDYLCVPRGGSLGAGDDVDGVVIADVGSLEAYNLTTPAERVIHRALALHAEETRR
jgi:8-oxo-dGTP diphosphatase